MARRACENGVLNGDLEPVQANCLLTIAYWRRHQAHPAIGPDRGPDLHVNGETSPVLDTVRAEPLHDRSRFFAIEANRFFACHPHPSRQAENIIDPARPDQGVVAKVALPAAHMMQSKLADLRRLEQVCDRGIEDIAQLKLPGLLPERPGMAQYDGPERIHASEFMIAALLLNPARDSTLKQPPGESRRLDRARESH